MKRSFYLAALVILAAQKKANTQQPFNLDTSFRLNAPARYINDILPLPDGDVIVSGQIKFPGEWSYHSGVRLNSDGSRDLAFAEAYMGNKLKPWNGKIYAGNGAGVRRNWYDGNLDASFDMANSPYYGPIQAGDYHVYPDGRILMSGAHLLQDSIRGFEGIYNLIWFSNTGYLDTTRTHRSTNGGVIYEIHELPDGKFLLSGYFSAYEGVPVPCIIRVHPDGALDPTFQSAIGVGQAQTFTVLADGRILASGLMKIDANSPDSLNLVRLMPDGALDPTFNTSARATSAQTGAFQDIWHTRLPDGRIVMHGNFDHISGIPRGGIAMFDADGNLLNDAFTGDGCGIFLDGGQAELQGTVGMSMAPDGSYYIFGAYYGYDDGTTNDTLQRFVSRLYGLDVGVSDPANGTSFGLSIYPNPARTWVTVDHHPRGGMKSASLMVRDLMGREVARIPFNDQTLQVYWDVRTVPPGTYLIELRSGNARQAFQRLVVQP